LQIIKELSPLKKYRLAHLLNPSSIAIVGASPSKNKQYQFNSAPLEYLIKYSYSKKVYPINPKYNEIEGYTCYPSILDVPDEIDVALLIVPAKHIYNILNQCEQKGVKSIIIAASGFAETGKDGIESQKKLKAFSERTGIPILGPNTLGLVNVADDIPIGFSVALEGEKINKGNIGFVSQSGATMSSIVIRAKEKKLGFSHMIATGNEGVLDISDFIQYMLYEESVEVIMVVAESIKDVNKFMTVADEALKVRKPIIIMKMGRTNAGKITALSHTGSMAGSSEINDALYRQKNVIIAQDIDDMLTSAELFSCKYNIQGNGVGIASTSGGGAGLTADLLEKEGLVIPMLSKSSVENLQEELDSFVKAQNPFDFAGQFIKDQEIGEKVFNVFAQDENIGLFVFTLHPVQKHSINLINQLIKIHKESNFPCILLWIGGSMDSSEINMLRDAKIPYFTNMVSCAKAISNLFTYHKYLKELVDHNQDTDKNITFTINHDRISEYLSNTSEEAISERLSKNILSQYGLPVTKEQLARTPDEAVKIANRIGYPVVMKIEAANVLHKTDIGGVKLGIKNDSEVRENYKLIIQNFMKHNPNSKEDGILVQEMIEREGFDFILGMKQDPECGPTILFGLGGIFTEIIKEYSLSVLPLNHFEVDHMLRNAKFNKLFDGYRGMKIDYPALKDFILRFAQFCWDYREQVAEVDINPLYAFNDGKGVVALDALISLKNNTQPINEEEVVKDLLQEEMRGVKQ
jgi:acetate---CoA ligase (ADP-forming)